MAETMRRVVCVDAIIEFRLEYRLQAVMEVPADATELEVKAAFLDQYKYLGLRKKDPIGKSEEVQIQELEWDPVNQRPDNVLARRDGELVALNTVPLSLVTGTSKRRRPPTQ